MARMLPDQRPMRAAGSGRLDPGTAATPNRPGVRAPASSWRAAATIGPEPALSLPTTLFGPEPAGPTHA